MEDNEEEDHEPVFGETRLAKYDRDGHDSIEIEIYTGNGWMSVENILDGKFTGGDESE